MEKKQIIEAMHNRLHEIDPHAKAILFGSRARGTEHEGSDWDVLILLDKPKVTLQDYDKYSYPLRELGWDIDEIINPVLFSQKEWEENHYTLFNHNVNKEGIAIIKGVTKTTAQQLAYERITAVVRLTILSLTTIYPISSNNYFCLFKQPITVFPNSICISFLFSS